jgi:threonine-phosphate decarboxylase
MIIEKPHGGRVQEAAIDLRLPIERIIDFSANINPLGQPAGLKALLCRSAGSTLHYPEIHAESLTADLAKYASLPDWTVLADAGTTPLIFKLIRVIGTKNHTIIAPAFSEYEAAFAAAGITTVNYYSLTEKTDFILKPENLEYLLKFKPKLVIVANPANPTGRQVPKECLWRLIEASNTYSGFWLVIDEAFIDFCLDNYSLESLIVDHPRLIILKSLTKIFAIPGLRLGYLACGHQELMQNLLSISEPWSINSLAQIAGRFLLTKKAYIEKTPKVISELRDYLIKSISPYIDTFPSEANFVMGRLKRGKKRGLIKHLYHRAILIRDLDGMPGLKKGYIRLAVRPIREIDALREALKEYHARIT